MTLLTDIFLLPVPICPHLLPISHLSVEISPETVHYKQDPRVNMLH